MKFHFKWSRNFLFLSSDRIDVKKVWKNYDDVCWCRHSMRMRTVVGTMETQYCFGTKKPTTTKIVDFSFDVYVKPKWCCQKQCKTFHISIQFFSWIINAMLDALINILRITINTTISFSDVLKGGVLIEVPYSVFRSQQMRHKILLAHYFSWCDPYQLCTLHSKYIYYILWYATLTHSVGILFFFNWNWIENC